MRANLVPLDANQPVDHLRPRQHAFTSHRFVALEWRNATVAPVPFEIMSARTDQNSFQ
jgi:hypothetical protein